MKKVNSTCPTFYMEFSLTLRTLKGMLIIPPIRSRNEVYMETTKLTYQKHLDQGSRIFIEKSLEQSLSLRRIALSLGKDPSTIAKEIKNIGSFRNIINSTKLLFGVLLQRLQTYFRLPHGVVLHRLCKRCPKCHSFCSDYTLLIITVLKQTKHLMSAMPVLPEVIAV